MEVSVTRVICILAIGSPAILGIDLTGDACLQLKQCKDEFSRKANAEEPVSICRSYGTYLPCVSNAVSRCPPLAKDPLHLGRIACSQKGCPPEVCQNGTELGTIGKPIGSIGNYLGASGKPTGSSKKSPGTSDRSTGSAGWLRKTPRSARESLGTSGKPIGSSGKSPGTSGKPIGSSGKSPGTSGKPVGSSEKSPGTSERSLLSTGRPPMKLDRAASVPSDDEYETTKTINEVNDSANSEPSRIRNNQAKTGDDNIVGSKYPSRGTRGVGGGTMGQGTGGARQEGRGENVDLGGGTMGQGMDGSRQGGRGENGGLGAVTRRQGMGGSRQEGRGENVDLGGGTMGQGMDGSRQEGRGENGGLGAVTRRQGMGGSRQEGRRENVDLGGGAMGQGMSGPRQEERGENGGLGADTRRQGTGGSRPQGKRKGNNATSSESKAAANNTDNVELPPGEESKQNGDKDATGGFGPGFGYFNKSGIGEDEEDTVLKKGTDNAEDGNDGDPEAIGNDGGMRNRSSGSDLGSNLEEEPLANQTGNSSAEGFGQKNLRILISLTLCFVVTELMCVLHLRL